MRGAEILWDQDMADRALELLEMGLGKPWPLGLRCPLLGDGTVVPRHLDVMPLDAVA